MWSPTVSSGTYGELLLIFLFVWQIVAMILHHTAALRWQVTHKAWFSRRGWYSCFSRCLLVSQIHLPPFLSFYITCLWSIGLKTIRPVSGLQTPYESLGRQICRTFSDATGGAYRSPSCHSTLPARLGCPIPCALVTDAFHSYMMLNVFSWQSDVSLASSHTTSSPHSSSRTQLMHLICSSTLSAESLHIQTRNMGQSPTWGRPAPQVRLEIQFMGLVGHVKIWGASAF